MEQTKQTAELLADTRYLMKLYQRMFADVGKQYGLTHLQVEILSFLDAHKTLDTAKDITQQYALTKSGVSQAVEALIENGMLCRRADADDRRVLHLRLCRSARPVCEQVSKGKRDIERQLFTGFSEQEQLACNAYLGRILKNTRIALG